MQGENKTSGSPGYWKKWDFRPSELRRYFYVLQTSNLFDVWKSTETSFKRMA